jgi:hypothetical protein
VGWVRAEARYCERHRLRIVGVRLGEWKKIFMNISDVSTSLEK